MNKKEVEQQIKDFADAMYRIGKDDGYKKGIEDTKAQLQRAYDNGYAKGNNTNLIDEAYQEGINDAWECARKLALTSSDGGFDNKIVKEIFGSTSSYSIINDMSISTVVAKIKDYEEKQKQKEDEIRVGDEVIVNDIDCKAIFIGISTLEGWVTPYHILFENGNTDWVKKSAISKTGKHYDAIEEVLKELRGDEE